MWRPFKTVNILLIGETGSGKSTLINYLTNYFLGGTLQNMKIAIPTVHHQGTEGLKSSEKNLKDATKSKTSDCTVYKFNKYGHQFVFIDTPGLSDTEGTERDDDHMEKIMSAAEKIEDLSAILLVINGTVARATVSIRNTLTRLRGSLPDVLLNNLAVVLTNCSAASANFDLKSLKPWKVSEKNVFYMNNSALSKPKDSWINNEKMMKFINGDWITSMEEIDELIKQVTSLGSIATKAFQEMLQKRNKIKEELHGTLLEVNKLQTLQDNLETSKYDHLGVSTDIERYSNFKQKVNVDYVEMEETSYHNTICMEHTDQLCHEHCGLPFSSDVGNNIFTGCACMRGSNCHKCGCDHLKHYHAKKKPVKKSKNIEKILEDVKKKYDQNTEKEKDLKKKISSIESDISALQKALKAKKDNIIKCCEELKKICSHFNFVEELKNLIDNMKLNARALTSMDARQVADDMIQSIKHLADELTKKPDSST